MGLISLLVSVVGFLFLLFPVAMTLVERAGPDDEAPPTGSKLLITSQEIIYKSEVENLFFELGGEMIDSVYQCTHLVTDKVYIHLHMLNLFQTSSNPVSNLLSKSVLNLVSNLSEFLSQTSSKPVSNQF